jgi:hypothetical protein
MGFGSLFRLGAGLHERERLLVAAERAGVPRRRDLPRNVDLSGPIEVLRVRQGFLQCRQPVDLGLRLARPAAARQADRAGKSAHRFDEGITRIRADRQPGRARPVLALHRPAGLHRRNPERAGAQPGVVLARHEVVVDLQREIESFLRLGVLAELQVGVDEIVEVVDAILRGSALVLRRLPGNVRGDRVAPAAEEHVGVRRHVDGVRDDRHARRIGLRRRERAVDQRRIVVSVNDVVAHRRMLRRLGHDLFEHGAGLDLVRIGFVERIGGREQRERMEDRRFAVRGIVARDLLHPARIGEDARAVVELFEVRIERCERIDVILLAPGLFSDRARLLDRFAAFLQIVGPGRRPELVPDAHRDAPMGHCTIRIRFGDRGEFLERLPVPKRMQGGQRRVEARLNVIATGHRKTDPRSAPFHQIVQIGRRRHEADFSQTRDRGNGEGDPRHMESRRDAVGEGCAAHRGSPLAAMTAPARNSTRTRPCGNRVIGGFSAGPNGSIMPASPTDSGLNENRGGRP